MTFLTLPLAGLVTRSSDCNGAGEGGNTRELVLKSEPGPWFLKAIRGALFRLTQALAGKLLRLQPIRCTDCPSVSLWPF
jgi:hypothetical protein